MTQEQMKLSQSQSPSVVMEMDSSQHLDECLTVAWLNLIAHTVDDFGADDWLSLCPDINEGELYRDWFIWFDGEVSQEWEAYDPTTEQRFVETDVLALKARIDQIETARKAATAA